MRTFEPSEEMSFQEFTQLFLLLPPDTRGVMGEFAQFLRAGCSELEAKRWLAAHLWDFPQEMREQLVMALAADALHTSAVETEAEIQAEFVKIWKKEGFRTAQSWYQRHQSRGGG